MIDFGDVIYLDMQKTGSTYITGFLKRHLRLDLKESRMHGTLRAGQKKKAYYFVSLRNPVEQYISLYRYGCDSKGGVFNRLDQAGVAEGLYVNGQDGFPGWLDFMTDPANAGIIDPRYGKTTPALFGFMTFRLLYLSMRRPLKHLAGLPDRDALRQVYRERSVTPGYVRTEHLNEDLIRLCETDLAPYLKDPEAAIAHLRKGIRSNVSKSAAISPADIDPGLRDRIAEREWLLYETFPFDR